MQKCPVCEGRKTVPAGFYSGTEKEGSTERETCQTCFGTGTINSWEPPGGERWEWPRSAVNVMRCDHGVNTVAEQAAAMIADSMTRELARHKERSL